MITPISLESEIEVVAKQVEMIRSVGAKNFHIDIIDGLFVDNITVSPADLRAVDLTNIAIDIHLLVDDPVEWVEECIALNPRRIFAQVERMGNIEYFLKTVKNYEGAKVGLGVGLHTPLNVLTNNILDQVDGIILMAIEMGYGGNPYHPEVVKKIAELRQRFDGWIVIDGGIKPDSYKEVLLAGANEAGANTGLWKGDFEENWRKFEAIEKDILQ